ncbi:MAG: nucleotidyltransferase family protein [Clostridia bacterium]|nr:nucleotidyltransferase family protein [Clostridia bacterium]
MLSTFEKGVISIIKTALTDSELRLEEGFDFDKLYEFGTRQQIIPIIYYGLTKGIGASAIPNRTKFLFSTANLTTFSEKQMSCIEKVFDAFDENGIEHLKMKGTILKRLYPYPEMRLMSDADIFVNMDKYGRIEEILKGLGFTFDFESNHEVGWKKEDICIELHKKLIPSYNEDLYAYFEDPWQRLIPVEKSQYKMSDEDTFVYIFTHFAKHYRDGGIGIKFMTDFYVYLETYKSLDFAYIEAELEKMKLLEFWHNTKNLIDVWFYGRECDKISAFITHKIFESDAYGTEKAKLEAQAVKAAQGKGAKNAKKRQLGRVLFPKYENMCIMYPVVKKAPILLPFMWVWRFFEVLFTRRKNIKKQFDKIDNINDQAIEKYDAELRYVGLPYNN